MSTPFAGPPGPLLHAADATAGDDLGGASRWAAWQQERLAGIAQGVARTAALGRQETLDAVAAAIREAVASGAPAIVILIDLNGFAEINATWGLAAGDGVLAETGRRIAAFAAERLGGSAVAGHLDADHFVLVRPGASEPEKLRQTAADLLRELARPVALPGRAFAPSARAALLLVPAHARSVATLMARGFRLLNGPARGKVDGVAVWEASESETASAVAMERDLVAALSSDQLFIALQPKVGVESGVVHGAEALARWRHPERGMLPPPTFIEAAERSGLIFDLGMRILRDACQASGRLAASGRPLPIAVNVSPRQLAHPDFLGRFLEVVDRAGVDPQSLSVEVTETTAMMGGERIGETLKALRRCSIGVEIDDFGTGFSNLAALSALPADTLKIDRSLVAATTDKSAALLGIAVQVASALGLRTVAEGVETETQMARVRSLGCDYVQGYLTGRPVDAALFAETYLRA